MCLGIPGQILEIVERDPPLAIVSVGGVRRVVNLSCIVSAAAPDATLDATLDPAHPSTSNAADLEAYIGDWVLVHVGFALERLDEDEAQATLDVLGAIAAQADSVPSATTLAANANR